MPMTLLFDTWGTLVDNYSIADVIEPHVYESHIAQRIAQDWRAHQKWAMFYTTLADSFVPHPGLNEACLRWALDRHHVELPEAAIQDIVNNYHKLRAYPDVINALNAVIVKAVRKEEFRARLAQMGADPIAETPEYFRKMLLQEIERWRKVVKASKAKPE